MNLQEAKAILALYRPGTADAEDPQVREALSLAEREPQLRLWLDPHLTGEAALRARFREIPVPADLAARILERAKAQSATHAAQRPHSRTGDVPLPAGRETGQIIRPNFWWRSPAVLAAAACIALLLGLAAFWLRPEPGDLFALFQSRMVGTVLRQYRMEVASNDMDRVRQFMASKGAPADFELVPSLDRLELAGGGFLRWQDHPVSMVCFRRPDQQMVYLFVMRASALRDPPPAQPRLQRISELVTTAWTRGDKAYFLAGREEQDVRDTQR